jgi:hypothetical protein
LQGPCKHKYKKQISETILSCLFDIKCTILSESVPSQLTVNSLEVLKYLQQCKQQKTFCCTMHNLHNTLVARYHDFLYIWIFILCVPHCT